jgi:KDO2-lipid IV(A) lauroyltransferase
MTANSERDRHSARWAERLAMRALIAVSRLIPATLFYASGWTLGGIVYLCSRHYRSVTLQNLTIAYGDTLSRKEKQHIAYRSFVTLIQEAMLLPKFVRLESLQLEKIVQTEHEERLKGALAKGGPVALVTAHLSNFPLAMLRLVSAGYRVGVLRRRQTAEEALSYLMTVAGVRSFLHKRSLLALARFLKDGGIVVFTIDQYARRGVRVPFFGVPTGTYTAPVRFAVTMDATIVPMFMHRDKWGRYSLTIEEPVDLIRESSSEALYDNLLKLSSIVETYVRTWPDQWLWSYRRWRDVSGLMSSGTGTHATKADPLEQVAAVCDCAHGRPSDNGRREKPDMKIR